MNETMPKGTVPEALLSCGVITHSGSVPAVQPRIEAFDGTYRPPWFVAHAARINAALTNIVGVSNAKALVLKTAELLNLLVPAYDDVSILKTIVENKFQEDKPRLEILMESLGYNKYFKKAGQKNQAALMSLVLRLNKSFEEVDFREEMITKGLSEAMLQRIGSYATRLPGLNTEQEYEKAKRKELTLEDKKEVIAIYNETIALSKLAYKIFKRESTLQDQFSYDEVLSHIRGGENAGDGNNDNNNPPPQS